MTFEDATPSVANSDAEPDALAAGLVEDLEAYLRSYNDELTALQAAREEDLHEDLHE